MGRGAALIVVFLSACLISGCSDGFPLFGSSYERAQSIAADAGMVPFQIQTDRFLVKGFRRTGPTDPQTVVYIEGDGRAFLNRSTPSSDPSPDDPIGLRLAAVEASIAPVRRGIVYFARPCQYLAPADPTGDCSSLYWTDRRYAPEIIAAYQEALDEIKSDTGAVDLTLVGYSGGGVIAAILAAERRDVSEFTTFATPLDLDAWARIRGLSPLHGSINPAALPQLGRVSQRHYVGERDSRIPVDIARSYTERIGERADASSVVVPGADHDCCWEDVWRAALVKTITE